MNSGVDRYDRVFDRGSLAGKSGHSGRIRLGGADARRGVIMLLLLLSLVVLSLVASLLIPEHVTITQRQFERDLRLNLGQIRMAMDMERNLATASPLQPLLEALLADPHDPVRVANYLAGLASAGYLSRPDLKDPLIPAWQWGTGSGKLYWQAQRNLMGSMTTSGLTSFESGQAFDPDCGTLTPVGWLNLLDPTKASMDLASDTPSTDDTALDDYLGQNRMGQFLSGQGHSLRIRRKP